MRLLHLRLRITLTHAGTLAVLGLCGLYHSSSHRPPAFLAEAAVYAFVDDWGELLVSNVPDNEGYGGLDTVSAPAAPAAPAGVEARDMPVPDDAVDKGPQRPYGVVIARVAEQYGIEAALLHAVISVESGHNAKAVSERGAAGLMQLMPETARRFGVADVFDPADNVRAGAQHLSALLMRFDNDLSLALAAYNAGEAAVIKYGRQIPPYRETAAYVPKVFDSYRKYRRLASM